MDEKKMQMIIKSIALAIESEQDAYDCIGILQREDWQWWIKNTRSDARKKDQTCVICGQMHFCGDGPATGMCKKCWLLPENRNQIIKLNVQRRRTKNAGLPSTLTLREWYETVQHFGYTCAYCLRTSPLVIEHFIPVMLGGGTTKGNCVPSCETCNKIKRSNHPLDVQHRLPEGAIERIQSYLKLFQ